MNSLAPIADILRKLIPRLASNHAGEVAATAAAIGRVLKSSGYDWHDLAGAICAVPKIADFEDWRSTLRFCAHHSAQLDERELALIARLASWRGGLPDRQNKWLRNIAARLRGGQ
jgi:hypothetical protein